MSYQKEFRRLSLFYEKHKTGHYIPMNSTVLELEFLRMRMFFIVGGAEPNVVVRVRTVIVEVQRPGAGIGGVVPGAARDETLSCSALFGASFECDPTTNHFSDFIDE